MESELVMEEGAVQPPTITTGSKIPSTTGTHTTTTTTTVVGEEEKTTNSRKQQHQLTITEFYERVPPEQTDDGQQISCPDLVPETDTFGDNVDKVEISRDDLLCPGRTPSSSLLQEVPDTSERGENNRENDHIMMESATC